MSRNSDLNNSDVEAVKYKVLVLLPESQEKDGEIWIPRSAQEKTMIEQEKGIVVSLGELTCTEPDWGGDALNIGDKVLFKKYSGSTIVKNKRTYRLIHDEDVWGKCYD
jgi:co-chaperonin GroES (HSP10)